MIFYNKKSTWKTQIDVDIKELEKYKNSYNKKITLCNIYLNNMDNIKNDDISKEGLNIQELTKKIQDFKVKVQKIDNNINVLNSFLQNNNEQGKLEIEKDVINKYNQEYNEIRNDYIDNSLSEEDITIEYINGLINNFTTIFEKMRKDHKIEVKNEINVNLVKEDNEIKNNDTLLISEKQEKVVLPYTAKEVKDF